MKTEEKIKELKNIIYTQLYSLIDNNFILLDVPYHYNIGDVLIWQGELDFLKLIPFKYLNFGYKYKVPFIDKSTVILLHGGGNFGDLWRGFQEYKLEIIENHPDNKIIIFPQTVFYEDKKMLLHDAKIMSNHKHLTICARDKKSYEILKKYFLNEILLIPDMAFFLNIENYKDAINKNPFNKDLYLKRQDKEYKENPVMHSMDLSRIEINDWPTENGSIKNYCMYDNYLLKNSRRCGRRKYMKWMEPFWIRLNDLYIHSVIKKRIIKTGFTFLSQYNEVYTTRLHGAILRILLNKRVSIIDNSYGKNSNFYHTWLQDTDGVKML